MRENKIEMARKKRLTKIVKKFKIKLPKRNIAEFFKNNETIWFNDARFKRFLRNTLADNEESPAEEIVGRWHEVVNEEYEDDILSEIKETLINVSSTKDKYTGRIEARRRLNILITEIEKYQKSKHTNLLLGYVFGNTIGTFRVRGGKIVVINCSQNIDPSIWNFNGGKKSQFQVVPGCRYLSIEKKVVEQKAR